MARCVAVWWHACWAEPRCFTYLLAQLSPEVRDLLDHILVPKEEERITIPEIEAHPWCASQGFSGLSVLLGMHQRRLVTCSCHCAPAMCCIALRTKMQVGHLSYPPTSERRRKLQLWSARVNSYHRYQKKLPHNYEKAEKELEKDQAKVDQYIAGRSISTVRLLPCSPRS